MATSKTTQNGSAKVTSAKATPAEKIARDLSAVKDGSTFADGTGAAFEAALAPVVGLAKRYGSTADTLDGLTRSLMESETAMRRTVARADGTPDLAGASDLWRIVLDAEVTALYRSAMGDARANKLRSSITSARSRSGENVTNAARFAVESTNGLGAKKVTVEVDGEKVQRTVAAIVADATPGTPIPDAVRTALKPIFAAQRDSKGNRAKGWDKIPTHFGGPSKQPPVTPSDPDGKGGGGTGTDGLWSNLRKALSEKVASNAAAEGIARTATTLADTYLGKPDSKPSADLIKDRAETAKYLRQAALILKHLANGIEDPDEVSAAKEALAESRIAG